LPTRGRSRSRWRIGSSSCVRSAFWRAVFALWAIGCASGGVVGRCGPLDRDLGDCAPVAGSGGWALEPVRRVGRVYADKYPAEHAFCQTPSASARTPAMIQVSQPNVG
jgi:hypothetical protein